MDAPDKTQEKFQGKYRISSTRLKNYDYSSDGAYFITICTRNREHFFGEIINRKMQLSKSGEIVADEWQKTAQIRKNISLGEFVVMPNHVHGVLIVERRDVLSKRLYRMKRFPGNVAKRQYDGQNQQMSKISPSKNSISVAIRFFKRQTTIRICEINRDFSWQPRFYDHIVRDDKSLNRIQNYIHNNPANWDNDSNNY